MHHMDSAQSNKQSKVQLEVTPKETDSILDRNNSNSSRTSDLSQDSAVSGIFQSDPSAVQPKPDVVESVGDVQTVENCRISSSSRSSTQIRLSGVLENHDPNRIPVSIFSGRSSTPMEWSAASNESLFSIHVGNTSFSRENFSFFTKSGELMMNPNSSQKLPNLPPSVEPAARVDSKIEITVNVFTEPVTSTGPQIPATSSQSVADHRQKVITPTDELRDRPSGSNDSMNSSSSFQFPLLGGEGAMPKTISSVSADSGTTQQQQPMTKLQSTKQQTTKQQSLEHQSPPQETASASPTTNSGSSPGWFSCLPWCRGR